VVVVVVLEPVVVVVVGGVVDDVGGVVVVLVGSVEVGGGVDDEVSGARSLSCCCCAGRSSTSPIDVPVPPDSGSPLTHSIPVITTMPRANASTLPATSTGQRSRRSTGGLVSSAGFSSASVSSASACSVSASGFSSRSATRTLVVPLRPTTFARTVRTPCRVRWMDRR
jgi:hypothetical protein